jgi:hypothetical protein
MIYYVKLMPDRARLFPGSNLRLYYSLATRVEDRILAVFYFPSIRTSR